MKILIKWKNDSWKFVNHSIEVIYTQGDVYEATVIGDHKVEINHPDHDEPIELDQCEGCGIWLTEDEEMYEDSINHKGHCDNCCAICGICEENYHRSNMSPDPDDDDFLACNRCLGKIPSE